MKPIAISYIRYSNPTQALGDSLRRQMEAAHAYAAERGLDLDLTLTDEGISAYRGRHRKSGALSRLLADIESGRIPSGSVLIIEHLDRLSREDPMTAMSQLAKLIDKGIEVVTLLGGRPQVYNADVLRREKGRLFEIVGMMLRANEESEAKSERLSAAWSRKRKAAAEGVAMTAECPQWLRKVGNHYEVIAGRDETIREIFRLSLSGLGKMSIAKRLNEAGIRSFSGTGWHASYIQKILTNPACIGEFRPAVRTGGKRVETGDVVKGYFPAVVDEGSFWRVQAYKGERRGGRRGRTFANIFSGLLRCGCCGGRVNFEDKGKKSPEHGDSRYLVCNEARRGLGCTHKKRWRYGDTERHLLEHLREIPLTQSDDAAVWEGEAAKLAAELASTKEQSRRLALAFANGSPPPTVLEVVAELDAKAQETARCLAEAERMTAKTSHANTATRYAELAKLWEGLAGMEGEALYEARAALHGMISAVVETITLEPDSGWTARLKDGSSVRYFAQMDKLRHFRKGQPTEFVR